MRASSTDGLEVGDTEVDAIGKAEVDAGAIGTEVDAGLNTTMFWVNLFNVGKTLFFSLGHLIRPFTLFIMSTSGLKAIAPVPSAADFLDIVLSKTQRKTPTVCFLLCGAPALT